MKLTAKDRQLTPLTGTFSLTDAPTLPPGITGAAPTGAHFSGNLWEMIRKGLADNRTVQSESHGGPFNMKDAYSDIPSSGGVLIGFNYTLRGNNTSTMSSLQPIYLTQRGTTLGEIEGDVTGQVQTVRARSGYVVSGMQIRGGGNFDGFSVTFTRLIGTALKPDDSYESNWVGMTEGGGLKEIDTAGGLAVGIAGKKYKSVGSVALVILPPPDSAAPAVAARNPTGPPLPNLNPGDTPRPSLPPASPSPELPARGQPYTSFEQMFATLPSELQPSGHQWYVGRRVSPELSHRLAGQPAQLTGEFASMKNTDDGIEVSLDGGAINYRGFQLVGEIMAVFPASDAAKFQAMRIHDKVSVSGTIKEMVVRGGDIDKAFLWLKDCKTN